MASPPLLVAGAGADASSASPVVSSSSSSSTAAASTSPPIRPKFNARLTSDRLREGAGLFLPPAFRTGRSNIRKDHISVFKELGLDA